MPVKSRSKTFHPGDEADMLHNFFLKEIDNAIEENGSQDPTDCVYVLKKKLTITITYEIDDNKKS